MYPFLAPLYTDFESNFFGGPALVISRRLALLAPIASVIYLASIWFGQMFMASRKPFDLRRPLKYWNLFLAVFSLIGALRTGPHLLYMALNHGLDLVFCSPPAFTYAHDPCGLWVVLFVYSKYIELIDTAFIVLRKKPLSFLHWYHHVTVLLYSWDSALREQPCGLVFVAMNYSVHAIMYYYYYLASDGRKRSWGRIVTLLQISQMVVGLATTAAGLWYATVYPEIVYLEAKDGLTPTNVGCYVSKANLGVGVVVYASYLCLFVQFFLKRYTNPSMPISDTDKSKSNRETRAFGDGEVKKKGGGPSPHLSGVHSPHSPTSGYVLSPRSDTSTSAGSTGIISPSGQARCRAGRRPKKIQ
eukprot:GHVN01026096.1.p1 GENE.GHVN01026096.1~~GHVN01026096.1.p1  ORF type:complete len:396 (+),score=51.23 GHVN01026096.1:115-1188(+)